jgi:hypothetical protein
MTMSAQRSVDAGDVERYVESLVGPERLRQALSHQAAGTRQ